MPIIRVAMKSHRCHRPDPLCCYRHAYLATKLVFLMHLAFTDALNVRLMERVQLVAMLPFLGMQPSSEIQESKQLRIKHCGLALDIPHHSSKVGLQHPRLSLCSVELLRLGVTALPSQRILPLPGVCLTKLNPTLLGRPHQPFSHPVVRPRIRGIPYLLLLYRRIHTYPFQLGLPDKDSPQPGPDRLSQQFSHPDFM